MADDWKSAPAARKVLDLADDDRPAWLWAGHGGGLIWSNRAATLFGARMKASGLKLADDPRPIKGQIARILRMGLLGHTTLSRMQFIAGRKPLSATCRCTPLDLGEALPYLLAVAVDPIAGDILDSACAMGIEGFAQADPPEPQEPQDPEPEPEPEPEPDDASEAPLSPDTAEHAEDREPEPPADTAQPERTGLGALVDKLARDKRLFEPLDESDDIPVPVEDDGAVPGRDFAEMADDPDAHEGEDSSDWGQGSGEPSDEDAFAADAGADDTGPRAGLWQLTGRGLTIGPPRHEDEASEAGEKTPPAPASVPEGLEQASRYNFEELSRILNERIAQEGETAPAKSEPAPAEREAGPDLSKRSLGALVPLTDEALVLNRLPIGILIFRDQDILFANRALVEMTGYENATMLRATGPGAIFPATDGEDEAGPVTHLVRRDGERVSVTARLQTVSWQGRHAVMLSARAVDSPNFSETEVKTFAAQCARLEGGSFIMADRAGRIGAIEDNGVPSGLKAGDTLANAVAPGERDALLRFLAMPARFAETQRPGLRLAGRRTGDRLTVFAEGRAGVVAGYFGIYSPARTEMGRGSGLPAASLKRISRELRQPLNTISGFSELMATEAFGPLANPRYAEYVRDIRAAGRAIGDLADELDDFVRLAEGQMTLAPSDIDLSALLADCLVKARAQAGAARVLLRSAISETLPFVRADATTLKQAVLNMVASAIAESRPGSKVVLSAQREDDGAVTIHVRDAQKAPNALAEQFVVFRDGQARDGTARQPVRSSIGLTLTRSLAAANACSLTLAPASESGTLMTLTIPSELVVTSQQA